MNTFDQIFQKYYHSLLLYGVKFISNENDMHDILQEIFAEVWEKGKYKFPEDHLKSYLYNAVRNGCLNYLRHQSVVRKHIEQEKVIACFNELHFYQSGEKSLIEKEELKNIYAAIESLPDNYKEVIKLSRFQGLKNKKIAEKLNVPVRTVETRLFRALSNLRKILTGEQIFILMNLFVKQHVN